MGRTFGLPEAVVCILLSLAVVCAAQNPCTAPSLNPLAPQTVTISYTDELSPAETPTKILGRWPGNYATWFTYVPPSNTDIWNVTVVAERLANHKGNFYPRVFFYMGNCDYIRFLTGLATNENWEDSELATVYCNVPLAVSTMYILVSGDWGTYGSFNITLYQSKGVAAAYDFPAARALPVVLTADDFVDGARGRFDTALTSYPPTFPFPAVTGGHGRYFYYKMPPTVIVTEDQAAISAATFLVDEFNTDEDADPHLWAFVGDSMHVPAMIAFAADTERVEWPVDTVAEYYILMTGKANTRWQVAILDNRWAAAPSCQTAIVTKSCDSSTCSPDQSHPNVWTILSFLATSIKSGLVKPNKNCKGATFGDYGSWYKYLHSDVDRKMTASVDDKYSDFDSQLFIYTGCDTNTSSHSCIAFNDDNRPGTCINSQNAQVDFDAVNGRTYYILLTGKGDGGGLFILRVFPFETKKRFPWEAPVAVSAVVLLCCCCRCCLCFHCLRCGYSVASKQTKKIKYRKRMKETGDPEGDSVELRPKDSATDTGEGSDSGSSSSEPGGDEVLDILP